MMSRSFLASAVGLLAYSTLLQNVAAQVTTSCQPLNTTCPADPAFGMDYNFNFNSTPNTKAWETQVGPVTYDATNGAKFTVAKQGDSPTIRTKFYFFFGRVEVWLKTAPGTGIISSLMLLSDDLDEIDWEFMGGNGTHAETNYFGKGVQDFHNAIYYPVNGGTQADYHNYTIDWTKDALNFYVDSQKVRTLLPKDANNTLYYPQTPMRLSMGIWAGGDPTLPEGTRQWAGGDTDYSKGPFNMYVKNCHITDYSTGSEYTYGDKTGSWESIQIKSGNSTTKEAINAVPDPTLADKWNALPSGAKTAVYAAAGGVGALIVGAAAFYCIRQRRRGAAEAKLAEQKADEERRELEAFHKAGINPDSFREDATEYNAKEMARDGMNQGNSYSIPNSPAGHPAGAAALGVGAGAAAMSGARSPMPLLGNGQTSPRSPHETPFSDHPPVSRDGPFSDRHTASRDGSFDRVPASRDGPFADRHTASRDGSFVDRSMHNASPAGSLRSPPPLANPMMRNPSPGHQQRSFTAPNGPMRVGSPGPGQGGYDMQRMASPGPMGHPQRSFTSGGYGPQPGAQPYGRNDGHDQGYWSGNNYR
ncbi:concanavalin A-like lectin/glucanase [Thozetella sp. PMI_491]|nr:concanavalin A-like lectin/glucanase [Thozetella sp. PMI_491]